VGRAAQHQNSFPSLLTSKLAAASFASSSAPTSNSFIKAPARCVSPPSIRTAVREQQCRVSQRIHEAAVGVGQYGRAALSSSLSNLLDQKPQRGTPCAHASC
jgi:hypothetical protein